VGRSLHASAITEVVLDPTGSAALTLDEDGGVRLWPDVGAESPQTPIELPIEEATWMSLARSDRGFVVAFLDTTGGAHVGRVLPTDDGATFVSLYEHPPMQPLFEIHVLDGGARILTLGIDHRIELWSPTGETVGVLDEAGFVPWQLRVAQVAGRPPGVVAVLGSPTRIQPLSIEGDRIAKSGPPRAVSIDRGPNRSDLAMSPDGSLVSAVRRPAARGKRFEIEFVELESNERRLFVAESDLGKRPRIHPVDATRVLVETGSGAGFFASIADAVAWSEDGDDTARAAISPLPVQLFSLAGSTEESRVHATLVRGTRVVPSSRGLVVDPIDGPARALETVAFTPTAVALDERGRRVAWATADALWIEEPGTPPRSMPGTEGTTRMLAFADDERIVAMDDGGVVELRRIEDGGVLATTKLDRGWGIATAGWRPGDNSSHEAHGSVVLGTLAPSAPIRVLPVTDGAFGSPREVPITERSAWPHAGKPRRVSSQAWIDALGMDWSELSLRDAEVVRSDPDATGERIAIVQKVRHVEGFDADRDEWVQGPHEFVVTMVDRKAHQRLWTRPARGFSDLAWSQDGSRFAFVGSEGGMVCDAATGDLVHTRTDLGLRAQDPA
jgi:hypothetical protein